MKTAVLLINLGTPDSYQTADVRKYLVEFLTDRRVIDIPAIRRNLLVRGIIAPFRAPKSAAAYKTIWTEKGSPLMVHSLELKLKMQESLGAEFQVELAMRYGNPSIKSVLDQLKKQALRKIKIIPLYPHYASASSGSVLEKVMQELSQWETIPSIDWVMDFYNDPGLIDAFVAQGKKYNPIDYDHVLFSFHGLPERQLIKADEFNLCCQKADCCQSMHSKNMNCYGAQSYETTRLIAERFQLPTEKYSVSFQSRLGKTPWKKPFTSEVLEKLAKAGKKKVLVFCPSFVCDCLETLYEISIDYQAEFIKSGGEKLQLVEGLNSSEVWVNALKVIALK